MPDGLANRFRVQEVASVDLHQQIVLPHPLNQRVIMQHLHIAVYMGNYWRTIQVLPQFHNFTQHVLPPMGHRRLNEDGFAGTDHQALNPLRIADAGKIQHLRSQNHTWVNLVTEEHRLLKAAKGLISPLQKRTGVLLISIKMGRGNHPVHPLQKTLPKHG